MKRLLILIQVVVTLIVSSCAASQAAPTVNPVDLQSTAVAAALTILAETQAALPTATPPSPTATVTNTAVPTNTFLPLPTEGAESTSVPGAGYPCINTVLPDSLKGEKIKIRIDNPTKATINLSVNLHPSNPQSVCGYRGYTLVAGESLVISDLVEGCYTLWAWNPDPNDYFIVTNGTSCLNSSNNWTFDVLPDSIRLRE